MWQAIATIAVPLLSALFGLLSTRGATRQTRKIEHHADLLGKLEKAPAAHEAMQELLHAQVARLRAREMQKGGRPINVGNLVGGIFFALVTSASIYGLWNWANATVGTPLIFISVGSLLVVGLLGLVVTAALFSVLYAPSKTPEERQEEKAARAKRTKERQDARAARRGE